MIGVPNFAGNARKNTRRVGSDLAKKSKRHSATVRDCVERNGEQEKSGQAALVTDDKRKPGERFVLRSLENEKKSNNASLNVAICI